MVYVITSFFFGYLIHVLFEAPFANLLTHLVKSKLSQPQLVSQQNAVPEENNNNNKGNVKKDKKRIRKDATNISYV